MNFEINITFIFDQNFVRFLKTKCTLYMIKNHYETDNVRIISYFYLHNDIYEDEFLKFENILHKLVSKFIINIINLTI